MEVKFQDHNALFFFSLCIWDLYRPICRWNSWDIIVNPGDVAGDILDRVFNPFDHFGTWAVTVLFAAFFM